MNDLMVICWNLIWLLSHKDVDDVHNDLSNHLDFLFLKENTIGLLESQLIAQFFQILYHCQQFFVIIENYILELILSNSIEHA